jgi:hypothetical protein
MNKEKDALKRYREAKLRITKNQHAVNGELVPTNQQEINEAIKEIKALEKEYPHFNFFKNSNLDTIN